MAIVLIEEVLMGLEEAKDSLERAVATLVDITADLTPDLVHNLQDLLETDYLQPLQTRAAMLETLLEEMATL